MGAQLNIIAPMEYVFDSSRTASGRTYFVDIWLRADYTLPMRVCERSFTLWPSVYGVCVPAEMVS